MAEETVDQLEMFKSAVAQEPPVAEPPSAEPQPTAPPEPAAPAPATEPEVSIPSWRLREEAEARRNAEQRAQALEARLNEIATHLRQNEKPQDFFDNPESAAQTLILRTLAPYAESVRRDMMQMGKMLAGVTYGADKVEEAEAAFMKARADQTLDEMDYERVVQSPNRYDAVVQWHKRQSVLTSVGDDPNAWLEKQIEARMADPQFQAKLLEKIRAGAAARPGTTKLPPSLSSVTAAAGSSEAVGDMSDRSLFDFAMKS